MIDGVGSIRRHRPSAVDRAAAAFLILLMAFGSLLLWVGIPAGWLWVAGKITAEPAEHILLSLFGVPIAMILWARGLFWVNRLYMRVIAIEPPELEEDDEEEPRWIHGPLESLLVGSLVIALIAMLIWFFVFAENPGNWFV